MPKIIEAIYKNGVIKPLEKLDLNDNERVVVQIFRHKERITAGGEKLSEVEEAEEIDITLPNVSTYREDLKKALEKVGRFSLSDSSFFSLPPVNIGKTTSRDIDLIIVDEAVRKK